jgi:cholesterol oxidase
MEKFEYIVLGTGFGGGTIAYRLAEFGKSVLVLERGRRWRGKNLIPLPGDPESRPFPEPGDALGVVSVFINCGNSPHCKD